ncbi:MAG: hypothetical protein OZSIB_3730 [Candidatus Ozemobacter sibiricus]|jgi:transcriptional regulator with XRE-family HTH domain|uniref:HTH cro/C1-type domain-containing protein n=1 Tax=Candidatus Ozemobacter sibiricus TaxID=2268124 RepID=A0A367ZD57_9BACT|nr:MAG: hypothetical protein OZSIB_3730 [Candidatus Ozemobacter sibiricus]
MPSKKGTPLAKSRLFATLFAEAEKRDEYHVAGIKIEIAEQIYTMMEKRGVNQSELARRLGKNRAYISKILKGTTNFTVDTLVRIARKLDAEWDIRLRESDRPQNKVFFLGDRWSERMNSGSNFELIAANELGEDIGLFATGGEVG